MGRLPWFAGGGKLHRKKAPDYLKSFLPRFQSLMSISDTASSVGVAPFGLSFYFFCAAPTVMRVIGQAIASSRVLRVADLGHNELGPEGGMILGRALRATRSLKSLNLEASPLKRIARPFSSWCAFSPFGVVE